MRHRRAIARRLLSAIGMAGALCLAVGGGSTAWAEPGADPAAWLYDPTAVVEIDLDLPQASIDALELDPDEYQPATFSLTAGGETHGPLSVGARLKGGAGSFRLLSRKAAFKVKFNEYVDDQTFFGLEKLTLNNMVQDPSMLHEVLAYELFRATGVAAPRTGYAFVRVNGNAYGLYLNVETLDGVSLPLWFSSTQHLYEGSYGVDVSPGGAGAFEVDEGKGSKREDLEALIAAVNAEEGDWSEGVDATADLEQMTRMWAVERYTGHWDGYAGRAAPANGLPNNYYLHSDQAGRFRMLPWGTDLTWVERLEFGAPSDSALFNRCLADASCHELYVDALEGVHAEVGDLELGRRAVELASLLAPCQALEVPPRREHHRGQIVRGVKGTRAFIAARRGELSEWLGLAPAAALPEGPPASLAASPCPPLDSSGTDAGATPSVPGPATFPAVAVAAPARGRRRCVTPARSSLAPVRLHWGAIHPSRPIAGKKRRCRR